MDEETVRKIVELNRQFYEEFASSFAESRLSPQPGYERLLDLFSRTARSKVLDVGCGHGRIGRFLSARNIEIDYCGVDFSENLLSLGTDFPGTFVIRDLSRPGSLDGLGNFDIIFCLSTLQHIPGHQNRIRLVTNMKDHLQDGGKIVIGNWQFLDSPRQKKKIRPWESIGVRSEEVEMTDYLLSWDRDGHGLRYVAYLNDHTIAELAAQSGLFVVDQYRSDGREGNLNLYSILAG